MNPGRVGNFSANMLTFAPEGRKSFEDYSRLCDSLFIFAGPGLQNLSGAHVHYSLWRRTIFVRLIGQLPPLECAIQAHTAPDPIGDYRT